MGLKGAIGLVRQNMDPQGDVPIDRCARWETNEPSGGDKERPQKLVLKKPATVDLDTAKDKPINPQ